MTASTTPYPTSVRIEGQLTNVQALALTSMLKQMGSAEFSALSRDADDAVVLRDAVSALQQILARGL